MADIGSTLREARIRARIDMQEVETNTKIRAKYLRAIENEEWELLPGPVYAKSFLRTYSDYLGLDSRMLVEEYKRRYEGLGDHEPRPVASLGHDRERERHREARGPLLPPWAPIALVLAAVVVVLYLVGTLGGSSKSPSATGRASTRRPTHHATHKRVALPATPPSATLQMTPTAPVYVCLVNARGKRLIFEKTYTVGETIPTFTQRKMLLTLGNANIQIKVNGKPYPVAQSSTAIRLQVTSSGVQPISMTLKPTCP
jgi:cytoskeleton protein RodZ